MPKAIKIFLEIFATLVLIVIACMIGLVILVNPNDYKDRIAKAITDHTNRTLTIHGNLDWSFFPWLGLKAENMQLSNPPGFAKTPFMDIGSGDFSIKLIPLIRGNVELGHIRLHKTTINMITNTQGSNNWSDFGEIQQPSTDTEKSSHSTHLPQENPDPLMIHIAGIDITDGQVNWIDHQNKQSAKLSQFNLHSKQVGFGKAFPTDLAFHLQSSASPIGLQTKLQGQFTLNPSQQHYQINELMLKTSWSNSQSKLGPVQINLNADLDYQGQKQQLTIKKLVLKNDALNANGHVTLTQLSKKPLAAGELHLNMQPRELLQALGYHITGGTKNALKQLQLDSQISSKNQTITLDQLSGKLDQTAFNGTLSLTQQQTQQLNFKLALGSMNVDYYSTINIIAPTFKAQPEKPHQLALNTPSTTATKGNAPAQTTLAAAKQNTSSATNKPKSNPIKLSGDLSAKKIIANETTLTNLKTHIVADNNITTLSPITANVYGGKLSGNIKIDQRQTTPRYDINATLSNIQLQQLAKTDHVQGKANVKTKLTMRGNTNTQLIKNLNGSVQLSAKNGVIKGLNLTQALFQVDRFIRSKKIPSSISAGDSSFTQLNADATIKQGVANSKTLQLRSPDLDADGSGSFNLNNNNIHYKLQVTAKRNLQNQQDQQTSNLNHLKVPMLVTGTLDNPKVLPDFGEIGKAQLQKQLGKYLSKQNDGDKPDVNKAIQKGLKSLFGQ